MRLGLVSLMPARIRAASQLFATRAVSRQLEKGRQGQRQRHSRTIRNGNKLHSKLLSSGRTLIQKYKIVHRFTEMYDTNNNAEVN